MSDQDRTGFVGGSDVAAILGISPWASPWSCWAEKVGLYKQTHSDEHAERLRIGEDAEAFLRRVFERRTGWVVAPGGCQKVWTHRRCSYLRGRADDMAWNPSKDQTDLSFDCGLEYKTDRSFTPWTEVPPYYQAQAQFYMAISGYTRWVFVVGFAGWSVEMYELAADRADQAFILNAARRFWRQHVLTGIPPDVDGSDATADAIGQAYSVVHPDEVAVVPAELFDARARLKGDIKAAEAALGLVENDIKARMGSAPVAVIDGRPDTLSWKAQTSTRLVGLKELREASPLLAHWLWEAGLTNDTETRTLRAHQPKKGKAA